MRTLVALALLLVLPRLALGDSPQRQGVEAALAAMQKAVLDADPQTYLAHVDLTDPYFAQEQKMWAADLLKHKPSAFTLAIADDKPEPAAEPAKDAAPARPPAQFDDDLARFELVMSWTMPGLGRQGDNLTRTVSFPVLFRRVSPADAAAPDNRSPPAWRYAGEDWLVQESAAPGAGPKAHAARARFLAGYESVAGAIVSVLPEVRDHVHEGFALTIDRVQEIKVYPSIRHMQASIYLSYADPLSGWNEPGETIKIMVSPKISERRLKALLAHEYGHVATFEMGPKATDMPWWILEGVAELSSEAFAPDSRSNADSRVRSWAKSGKLVPFDELSDFRSVESSLHTHVYKQGQHMVGYLSERFGRDKRNAWLRTMAQGASIADASTQVLGQSFAQLDTQWREQLNLAIDVDGKDDKPPADR